MVSEWRLEYLQFYRRYHCRLPLRKGRKETFIPDFNFWSILFQSSVVIVLLNTTTLSLILIFQGCLYFGHFKQLVLAFIRQPEILKLLIPWLVWYVRRTPLSIIHYVINLSIVLLYYKFCTTVSVSTFRHFFFCSLEYSSKYWSKFRRWCTYLFN